MDGELVPVIVHDHEHLQDPAVPRWTEMEHAGADLRLVRRHLDAPDGVIDRPADVLGVPPMTLGAPRHEHE